MAAGPASSGPSRSTSRCRRGQPHQLLRRRAAQGVDQVGALVAGERCRKDFSGLRRAVVHGSTTGTVIAPSPAAAVMSRLPSLRASRLGSTPSPTNSAVDTPNSGAPSAVARSRITCFAPSSSTPPPRPLQIGRRPIVEPGHAPARSRLDELARHHRAGRPSRVISTTWGSPAAADDGQLHLGARCATKQPHPSNTDIRASACRRWRG